MQSRPLLAVLNEDSEKIRYVKDSREFDSLINYLITLLNLKASSKEEIEDLNIQMVVIEDFIKTKFDDLTIPEVKEAFKMYLAKEFENIKVFRLLDCVVVGEILNAYKNFRNESLKIYDAKKKKLLIEQNENKMSTEEINQKMNEAVNQRYETFKAIKDIDEPIEGIFKHLIEMGKLKMPSLNTPKLQIYYNSKIELARTQILKEYQSTASEQKDVRTKIKGIIEAITNNTHNDEAKVKIEIRAKKLVLIDYFENEIKKGTDKIF